MIKHLRHVDDMAFTNEGITAIDALYTLLDILSGKPHKHSKITVKYDGAPAVVFGVHPETKRFFVGTKSVFNKRKPIFCYSNDDIQSHYGNKPELATKLWYVFNSVYQLWDDDLIPTEGVYQADFMYSMNTLLDVGSMKCFTPNTITYGAVKGTDEYNKLDALVGLAIHTSYIGDTMLTLKPYGELDMKDWQSNDKVNWIDCSLDASGLELNSVQIASCHATLEAAEYFNKHINASEIAPHSVMLMQFINYCIRIGEPKPSIPMYTHFLNVKGKKELIKTAKLVSIESALKMRYALSYTKRIIMSKLNDALPFYHECDGDTTAGEGYVYTYHGVPMKLVDRMEFSRRNFHNMRFVCQK